MNALILQPMSVDWPFGVVRRVLWGLFQQRDVNQSTGENEQHRQCVCSPAENEWNTDSYIKKNMLKGHTKLITYVAYEPWTFIIYVHD